MRFAIVIQQAVIHILVIAPIIYKSSDFLIIALLHLQISLREVLPFWMHSNFEVISQNIFITQAFLLYFMMGLLRSVSYIMQGWRITWLKGNNSLASLIYLWKGVICFFTFVISLIFIISCICCIEAEASMWPRYSHDRILLECPIISCCKFNNRTGILSRRCFSIVCFFFECPRTPVIMMIKAMRHFPIFLKASIDRV